MKQGKKLLAVMMAAMFAAGTVAGCGSTGTKATQADQTTAAEETSKVDETTKAEETTEAKAEKEDVYVFIAASLKNTMEKIKETYEKDHPNVNIIYNADSSGTLQTQIEEGAQCDIFFSAATKQMDALKDGGFVVEGSISNLLENKIVLIKPKDGKTEVTGFDNITKASSLALAGEDVPVGQYARKLFTNLGTLDQVMKMEINEGANVTAVLTAVAASMADKVEIIAEADNTMIDPAVYPVGLIIDKEASEGQAKAAADFKEFLVNDEGVMKLFTDAGFAKSSK